MIDRHGKPIYVGWAEHEILWLEAAMSLPFLEQQAAYRDIAALSGRTEDAIRYKVGVLLARRNKASAVRILVPEKPAVWTATRRAAALPSAFAAPSKAQLTAGNGRLSRRRPLIEAAE